MNKMLKFILIGLIVFGMVLPSYASLSSSDGSSFVTKAEFDSALADFNSKLTTFEAGVNSKIDSQVAAYLDRNGIWAGKVQRLNEDVKSFYYFQNVADTNTINKTVYAPRQEETDGAYYNKLVSYTKNVRAIVAPADVTRTGVNEVSKSGLFVMPYMARFEYCNDKNDFDTFQDCVMNTNTDTGRGAHYWIHQYFEDGGEYSNESLDSFVTTNKGWEGLYYGKTDSVTYENFEYNQHFIIKEVSNGEEIVRYDANLNNIKGNASTFSEKNDSNGMWMYTGTFTDPIVEQVAMFFVKKGSKLNFVSHIELTGWQRTTFFHQWETGCSPMCMVIKPTSFLVY